MVGSCMAVRTASRTLSLAVALSVPYGLVWLDMECVYNTQRYMRVVVTTDWDTYGFSP